MNKKRKTYSEEVSERQIELPNSVIYRIVRAVFHFVAISWGTKFYYHFDEKQLKGKQVILLADHAAFDSYIYTLAGYKFTNLNFVVGFHHAFNKIIYGVGRKIGFIPKRNFEVDLKAVRHMVQVIQKGGSLCIFPEGTFSFSGANHAVNPSTINFIKQLGVTVVLCRSHGAYCSRPTFKSHSTFGHREIDYEILFTSEQLKQLSNEEIDKKLFDSIKYNDVEWARENKHPYRWPITKMKGIDTFLYTCPNCGKQYVMDVTGRNLVCRECGNVVHINRYYQTRVRGKNVCPYVDIVDWYNDERRKVKKEIEDPNFSISYDCDLYSIHTDKARFKPNYIAGEGNITISHKGIRYVGTRDGKQVDLLFDIKLIPCFKYDVKRQNILNYHNEYFCFRPKKEKEKTIKYMMIVEEIHNLHDDIWRKAYEDAYGK